MPDIGPLELVIILVIILVIFGPKRLPGLGKQLGTGMREFKDGITGKGGRDRDDDDDEDHRDPDRTGVAGLPAAESTTTTPDVRVSEREQDRVRAATRDE
jgi:TatA/E family protein of Tat protein translocase